MSSQRFAEKLAEASEPLFKRTMGANTIFIGIGTTGSQILIRLFEILLVQTDGGFPSIARFMSIDADKDPRDRNSVDQQTQIDFLPLGHNGAGTAIDRGREIALKKSQAIYAFITRALADLTAASDAGYSTNLAGAALTDAVIIGGSAGGTSGGMLDVLVTQTHRAADQVGIGELRVHLVTVGDEMPVKDVERDVDPERQDRIAANAAENNQAIYDQMASSGLVNCQYSEKKQCRIAAATRVARKLEFDRSNANVKLQTTSELNAIIAESVFQQFFTASGRRRDSRWADEFWTGLTGQVKSTSDEKVKS